MDIICIMLSYDLLCVMNYGWPLPPEIHSDLIGRAFLVLVVYISIFYAFRLYHSLWEYAGIHDVLSCAIATIVATVTTIGVDTVLDRMDLLDGQTLKISVYFTAALLITAMTGLIRVAYRLFRRSAKFRASGKRRSSTPRVMIIGAGDEGLAVVKELAAAGYVNGRPIIFVDDNEAKKGNRVEGVPIVGSCDKIPEFAERYRITDIIYAINNASAQRRSELLKLSMSTGCTLKKIVTMQELDSVAELNKSKIRKVEITDLLARPEVKLNNDICAYLTNQTVMVTGGGGSIGSEICTQVSRYNPERVIIFDNYENNAFILKNKLDRLYAGKVQFFIRIGSVQDPNRLKEVFDEFKPSVVFHAAAHKHVPLMEDSPYEAVKNNIFGTYNTAAAAIEAGVKKFVILSTDKAVNPTNVMGATKRVTELIIQYFERKNTGTHFAAVRFGNVLGSNGSVIPIFEDQIAHGGPVTVTHKDITRYFMTIPEAAQLVCQAGGLSKGGEIFVLDMGEPVSITSLAEKIITLSGYKPYEEIKIEFTGLRPGEKLYEELTLSEEKGNMHMTANEKIFVLPPVDFEPERLEQGLEKLKTATQEQVKPLIKSLVPNYHENKQG